MASVVKTDPTSITIEIVYRGIFQKTLAQRICRSIVLAARKRGHTGTAFGRYGDSPERNGVPAKYFAVVAISDLELESSMAKYEPKVVDIAVAVDDTLVKGVESWAWYGRQPIWKPVHAAGAVLVTSEKTPDQVLAQTDTAERPYLLGIVPGLASFAGLWVFKDDHTDYRVLGALAKVAPDWVRIEDVKTLIQEQTKDGSAVASAQEGFDKTKLREVKVGEGTSGHEVLQFESTARGRSGRSSTSTPASNARCAGSTAPTSASRSPPRATTRSSTKPASGAGSAPRSVR